MAKLFPPRFPRIFNGAAAALLGLSVASSGLATRVAAAEPKSKTSSRSPTQSAPADMFETHVVIKNVCAWPNLVRLKNGNLVAIVFNQPNHGLDEGDVDCWGSTDGREWKRLSTVTQHLPKTVRMNHAAGLNRNGEIVVLCNGWDKVDPQRDPKKSRPIHTVVAISRDGGVTWDRSERPALPQVPGYSWQVPFGDIIEAANGDLVVGTYAFGLQEDALREDAKNPTKDSHDGMRGHVYAARSRDGGRTWDQIAPVVKDRHVEAAMLHAGGGRWVSVSRRFTHRDLEVFVSDDDAFTWKRVGNLDLKPVSAAHLLKMSDGRILLTYGNRKGGDRGIDARTSNDGGKTWNAPQRLAVVSGDLGYPDALEFPGGRLLVGYYASTDPLYKGYHMGVLDLTVDKIR